MRQVGRARSIFAAQRFDATKLSRESFGSAPIWANEFGRDSHEHPAVPDLLFVQQFGHIDTVTQIR